MTTINLTFLPVTQWNCHICNLLVNSINDKFGQLSHFDLHYFWQLSLHHQKHWQPLWLCSSKNWVIETLKLTHQLVKCAAITFILWLLKLALVLTAVIIFYQKHWQPYIIEISRLTQISAVTFKLDFPDLLDL